MTRVVTSSDCRGFQFWNNGLRCGAASRFQLKRETRMTANPRFDAPALPALDPARFVDVDLYSQKIKADPSPWFLQWADKPPFYVMIHGRPNAVICRHEEVKQAFAD